MRFLKVQLEYANAHPFLITLTHSRLFGVGVVTSGYVTAASLQPNCSSNVVLSVLFTGGLEKLELCVCVCYNILHFTSKVLKGCLGLQVRLGFQSWSGI